LLPLAQWHRDNQPKIANVECWRLAKAEVDAARKRKAAFRDSRPIGELGLGLAAYAAWQGCVTSGTESCFSKARRNHGGRELLGQELETHELRPISDLHPEDEGAARPCQT